MDHSNTTDRSNKESQHKEEHEYVGNRQSSPSSCCWVHCELLWRNECEKTLVIIPLLNLIIWVREDNRKGMAFQTGFKSALTPLISCPYTNSYKINNSVEIRWQKISENYIVFSKKAQPARLWFPAEVHKKFPKFLRFWTGVREATLL